MGQSRVCIERGGTFPGETRGRGSDGQFNTVRTRQHAPVLEHGSVGRKNGGVAVAYITPSPIRRHNANLVLNFICSFQRSKMGNPANAKSETAEITRWNKHGKILA